MSVIRAKAIIENIADKTLTNEEIIDLAIDYLSAVDPNFTYADNEELAVLFINLIRRECQRMIKLGRTNIEVNASTTITDAGNILDETIP